MANHEAFAAALEELRFDDAAAMVAEADNGKRRDLERQVSEARRAAEGRARRLVEEIRGCARAHDHMALLRIDADPLSARLLALVPASAARSAEVHLEGARVWQGQQAEKTRQRLAEAAKALDEFDLHLARGLLDRIDVELLHEDGRARFDQLILTAEARAMEAEAIQGSVSFDKGKPGRRRRRWFHRRRA